MFKSKTASQTLKHLLVQKSTRAKVVVVKSARVQIKTKQCTQCKRRLPRSEFHKQNSTKDGLRYECKKCNSKRALKAYYAKTTLQPF